MIHFPTNWGAKEPQNLPNHRVVKHQPLEMMVGNQLFLGGANVEEQLSQDWPFSILKMTSKGSQLVQG